MGAIFECEDCFLEIKQISWPVLRGGKITIHGGDTTISGGTFIGLGEISYHLFVFKNNEFKGMFHLNETGEDLVALSNLIQSEKQDEHAILTHVIEKNTGIEEFLSAKIPSICERIELESKLQINLIPKQGSVRKLKI